MDDFEFLVASYVSPSSKLCWLHSCCAFMELDHEGLNVKLRGMIPEKKKTWDRKGGRPKKVIRRDQQLAVMCTLIERKLIVHKARTTGTSVSQFLREVALKGQVDSKIKTLPKEILLFTATLNHLAANVNQVAKKRNREETFNAIERAEWKVLSEEVKQLAEQIKKYIQ